MIDLLESEGFAVSVLPRPEDGLATSRFSGYSSWLGVSENEDALQTIEVLRGWNVDWLIVDHYALGRVWERLLRPYVKKVMVVDDLADRSHDCDVMLDQNYSNEGPLRYQGLIPNECVSLIGPRYALLHPAYASRRTSRTRDGNVRRVLIFFGGSDPHNMTRLAVDALLAPGLQHLIVDVVIGPNYRHRPALEKVIASRPLTVLHPGLPHLADLMLSADLAIGAGGTTTWERMCLGVPSLVVSISENQEQACHALSRAGLIRYLGKHEKITAPMIGAALVKAIKDPQALTQEAMNCQATVDGMGSQRVLELLHPTPTAQLSLRRATLGDALLYFAWVNDPDTRRQAIQTQRISLESHQRWFAARLASEDSYLFVMCAGELPVGQIRFDVEGTEARIDYSVDPCFRGRGWAKQLVLLGMQEVLRHSVVSFRADVKEGNSRSCAVFTRLGFVEFDRSDQLRSFILRRSDGGHG